MLVLLTALLAGILGGYAAGGRLRHLDTLRFAQAWLVALALLLQIVAFSPLGAGLGEAASVALHIASYVVLAVFVLLNRHSWGVVVAGLGMGLNMAAITLNGGFMPASRTALNYAGVAYAGETSNNSGVITESTHLAFLGDVFATPSWLPAANVFSVGDVLIVVGVAIVIAFAMRRRACAEVTP